MPLSEADTHAKLVNPAIYALGWTEDHIKREETTGAVDLIAGKARRRAKGRTDLTLRIVVTAEMQPVAVAVIEVKKDTLPPGHGLDQAKGYAKAARLNVPFVFSTNGHMFVEFDRNTGHTTAPRPLPDFPSPADLRARYEAAMGFALDSAAAAPLLRTYKGGEGARRYYQDAAIRAVFEKIARDQTAARPCRALLSLATGAGKTFIAANLLRRIDDAGQLKRALFLCDRDELRRQALGELTNYFGDAARPVFRDSDGKNHARNAAVHVATYQTLGVDTDDGPPTNESFLTEHYPPDHFSHIIIDECHRSAWGKWSKVLTMNPNAVQIGLTATPRQLTTTEDTAEARADAALSADNLNYFGPPVYEYEIGQAMEDGYLAAMDVKLALVDLDARGITLAEIVQKNPTDANTGQPLTPQQIADRYDANSFERGIILPDRVKAMCRDLFEQMLANIIHRAPDGTPLGARQKSIIFCATDRHADLVATEMNNLFAAYTDAKGEERFDPYAFKCTASVGGNDFIPDFRGSARTHFVAATVELLSTGVDVKPVRNVVFFKYVASPIAFYQMIGRGTRIDEPTGKLVFTIYDYTGACRLLGEAFIDGEQKFTINGEVSPDVPPVIIPNGEIGIISLENETEQEHPFHLHGFFFQVLARNGVAVPPNDRFNKDTIILPMMSTMTLAARFDEQGMWQAAVHDDGALGALLHGIEAGLDLGDHAAVDDPLFDHLAGALGAEFGDQLAVAVEHPGDIGQHHQPAGAHRRGDGPGDGNGVDVEGFAIGADTDGRDDRNDLVRAAEDVEDQGIDHLGFADQAKIEDAFDIGFRIALGAA